MRIKNTQKSRSFPQIPRKSPQKPQTLSPKPITNLIYTYHKTRKTNKKRIIPTPNTANSRKNTQKSTKIRQKPTKIHNFPQIPPKTRRKIYRPTRKNLLHTYYKPITQV